MKDTIIVFDNTKDDTSVGKIQGNYNDLLIGLTSIIYQISIKSGKKPSDIVLDLLDVVRDNECSLYKFMKEKEENSQNE